MKRVHRNRLIIFALLVISLMVLYRKQVSYIAYHATFIPPLSYEVFGNDELFFSEIPKEINFWSPSFSYSVVPGMAAGDKIVTNLRDNNTIVINDHPLCEQIVILNDISPDEYTFTFKVSDFTSFLTYKEKTYRIRCSTMEEIK